MGAPKSPLCSVVLQDLGLAMDAAKANDASTPLGQLANQIYTQMSNEGWAEKDFSSAYEWLQKK